MKRLNNKLNIIKKLNKKLNSYSYGIIHNNKIINPKDESDFYNWYHYLSPLEVDKYKCGVCWDLANYQEIYLKQHNINCQNYYIELKNEDKSTHTFTICKLNNKYIYLESSFKIFAGIYEFDNINECLHFIIGNVIKFNNYKDNIYYITKYSNYHNYGVGVLEYMNYMHSLDIYLKIYEE